MTDLRYPIGKFAYDGASTEEQRNQFIADIEKTPAALRLNAYVRFKLALTEDAPTIKPYLEDRWAELPDSSSTPVDVSLALLENLHARWVRLLKSLVSQDSKRAIQSPRPNGAAPAAGHKF